jgi:hypothetical protein
MKNASSSLFINKEMRRRKFNIYINLRQIQFECVVELDWLKIRSNSEFQPSNSTETEILLTNHQLFKKRPAS